MFTRQRLTIVTALAFALIMTGAPAFSATIAGTKCSKAGASKTLNNLKFTCIKSGKKLIWNKGVAVKSPTNSGITTSPAVQAQLGARMATITSIQLLADRLWKNSQGMNVEDPIMYTEKNHPANALNLVGAKTARQMIMSFSPMFPNFPIYMFDSQSWINNQIKDSCPILVNNLTGGGAQVGCGKLIINSLNSYGNDPARLKNNPAYAYLESAHETFHLAQAFFESSAGGGAWEKIPAWYREGSAMVFGNMVASVILKKNPDYATISLTNGNSWKKEFCATRFETWRINNAAEPFNPNNSCEYSLGQIMIEYLVNKVDAIDKVLLVYQMVAIGNTFDEAIKYAFGIEKSALFTELDAYLTSLNW